MTATKSNITLLLLLLLLPLSTFAEYEVPGIPLEISGELNSHYRLSFTEQQKEKGRGFNKSLLDGIRNRLLKWLIYRNLSGGF